MLSWLRCKEEKDASIITEIETIQKEIKQNMETSTRFLIKAIGNYFLSFTF